MAIILYDMLKANFGVSTTYNINPIVGQVLTSVTKILSYNPNRLGLVIVNNGAVSIYISPVNIVTVGSGLILVPGGGSITFKWDVDFELVSLEYFGIADGAASNIFIMEVVSI